MSSVFPNDQGIVEVGQEWLTRLKEAALADPLKRARLCLHHSHRDPVHQMIIAICRGSYVRPHRHANKSESFHMIDGDLDVVFFDDAGHVTRRVRMGADAGRHTLLYRLSRQMWHTVLPLSELAILHEITTGPFVEGATEYAPWSPEEDDAEGIRAFFETLAVRS